MARAFASQADLVEKKITFSRLSEHAYAFTAEGDPNTGIVVGDDALVEFTRRWDGASLTAATLRVPAAAIAAAPDDTEFALAFRRAVERIRRFHIEVKPRSVTVEDPEGARLGIRWTPLRSVGLYVPGGKAAYPSSVLMNAIGVFPPT